MSRPVGVGIVGAGTISDQYLTSLAGFADAEVLFIADLDLDRARAQAEAFDVAGAGSVAELLAHPDIEIVVNLTIPAVHVEVSRAIVDSGRHVWSEKPLGLDVESSRELLERAARTGVRVACAPDTVLGAGLQQARRAIDSGAIGTPLTAITMLQSPGPDMWHPNPEFLFADGAGPLLDMGPYYLTSLVCLFGAVASVTAVSSLARPTRTIATGPRAGTEFEVTVPTHVGALLEFEGGQSAQCTFSFESGLTRGGFLEVTGTGGTAVLPNPNAFDGGTALWRGSPPPEELPSPDAPGGRGIGVIDLARSLRDGRPERCSGALALHVLDVMLSIAEAASSRTWVDVRSTVERPDALPEDWDPRIPTL